MPEEVKKILIFGAGGHSKVIADIARSVPGISLDGLVVPPNSSESTEGVRMFNDNNWQESGCRAGVVAVGDNTIREKIANSILSDCPDFEFVSLVHPTAVLGAGVKVGPGSVVMAGAVLNSGASVGEHSIANTSSVLEHDVSVGRFSSIAPGAIVGGDVSIGDHSAISIGATVSHGIQIGSCSVIGAGSVVTKDIESNVVAFGNPCKVIRARNKEDKYL